MFSYVTKNNISVTEINSAAANEGADELVGFIKDTRQMLQGMGLSSLPVGNSDAGSYFNNEVLGAVDFGVRSFSCFIRTICISFGLPIYFSICALDG
jgi:hypothetical protein